MDDSTPVRLDVGGEQFETTVGTLRSHKNSYFEVVLDERWSSSSRPSMEMFIDRDPTHFPVILSFIRGSPITVPQKESIAAELKREAEYYCLDGLLSLIRRHEITGFGKGPLFPGDRVTIGWEHLEKLEDLSVEQPKHLCYEKLNYMHGPAKTCSSCGVTSEGFSGLYRNAEDRRGDEAVAHVNKVYSTGDCCDISFGLSSFIYHVPSTCLNLVYDEHSVN